MIVIVGESASGKSSLQNYYIKKHPEYRKGVVFTTRPKRDGEVDGIDYNFVSTRAFNKLVKSEFFAVIEQYRDWYYGVPKSECESKNSIAIMSPASFRNLKNQGFSVTSVYLFVDRKTRLINSLLRGDNIEEAYRRNLTEVGQFDGVAYESDYVISNSDFHMDIDQVSECLDKVIQQIENKGGEKNAE